MEQVEYGSIDLISISEIVSRTKVRLGIKDITDYDDEIELFINESASKLKTRPTFRKKDCFIEVCDGKAKLPKGFAKYHTVLPLYDHHCNEGKEAYPSRNGYWYGNLIYMEDNNVNICRDELNSGHWHNGGWEWNVVPLGTCQIIGGQLCFSLPCKFKAIILSFDGFAIDKCSGILEMHPDYEKCFSEYARGMMLDTYNFLYNGEPSLLRETIQRSLDTAAREHIQLVGDAFADDMARNKFMVKRILHGLLQDQNRRVID